ncbi:MAG: cache domain-containing protein [Methanolinea sp.]|nr:cache domain-containing protein [Methanolinea sp.]
MDARIPILLVVLVLISQGCITSRESPESFGPGANATLAQVTSAINAELESVRDQNVASANQLSLVGLAGRDAERVLTEKLEKLPWALSSVTISSEGFIVAAVPENYREIVGRDVTYQDAVQEAFASKAPRVSKVFLMEEGFAGISQSEPVFAPNGTYLGYTDVTYRPEVLIGRAVDPIIAGTPFDVWVVQKDGRILYDTSPEEIGRNLFSDAAYQSPELQAFFSRVISEPSGRGVYQFWDRNWDRVISKEVAWGTAGIDGAEWRVVLTTGNASPMSTGNDGARTLTKADARDLDALVKEAVSFAREKGKDVALLEFNNPEGRFVSGDRYIFAYDMNGTVLALPFQKGLIGESRLDVQDSNGVSYIRAMVAAASRGGGHVTYVYPNPARGFAEELKRSSVFPVDGTWFVGSGIYLPHMDARFSRDAKDALQQRVKKARDFAQERGREEALSAFNDLSGPWAAGSDYIFAYAMDGTTLALPFQPELIGTNRTGFQDHYGVAGIAWETEVARDGGGFVYIMYPDPKTGLTALKLCYVVPVDREWFVGSGIYSTPV